MAIIEFAHIRNNKARRFVQNVDFLQDVKFALAKSRQKEYNIMWKKF